ncbi:uncharacterized protein LOC128671481 isoform X2 [Plodia interpunctella]|nr:uncharacterized protein LOC128671481 isoform X2 [Plodia interpunctella]
MIWADTSRVGCGRARFYVEHKTGMVDRLVCNFALRGNYHGKPVYAIGYPATQCPDHSLPDESFQGLCSHLEHKNLSTFDNVKKTSGSPRVSSLLRILNLSNSTAKQAIDPIRNIFRPLKPNANLKVEQKNQKIRHIENITYTGMNSGINQYNMNPIPVPSFKYNQNMMAGNFGQERGDRPQERGHSRVYHGHYLHTIEEMKTTQGGTAREDFRRFNFMPDSFSGGVENSPYNGRCNGNNECTRKDATVPCPTETRCVSKAQCTRRPRKDYAPTQEQHIVKDDCPCNIPTSSCSTPAPLPTKCMCNINCKCLTTRYPNYLRIQTTFTDDTRKSAPNFEYYDQVPNIGIRSGEKNNGGKETSFTKGWPFKHGASIKTELQTFTSTKKLNFNENDKSINNFKDYYDDYMGNIYKKLDNYRRNRRESTEESTFKPFWQIDELTHKISPQLKSLRYTTLSNRQKVNYRKPTTTTEFITINLSEDNDVSRKLITEKYLSFDELMRLRKFGEADIDIYGARRVPTKKTTATTKKAAATTKKASATTKKATATTKKLASTTKNGTASSKKKLTGNEVAEKSTSTTKSSEITANTPFERKKHCTRKLTCTWTAVTVTGADGSVIGGWEVEKGSLTPSGYVDGCTRTSTCTRIYMNRNKFSTIGDSDIENERGEETSGDGLHGGEDYCEKRALDIRRRDSGVEFFDGDIVTETVSQMSSPPSSYGYYDSSTEKMHSHEQSECTCEENLRVKRDENRQNNLRETISYGDLYYRVLKKIISGWRIFHSSDKSKCACNDGLRNAANIYSIIIFNYLVI